MNIFSKIEKIAYSILLAIVLFGLILGLWDDIYFDVNYAQEDGPVEWGTAIMLLVEHQKNIMESGDLSFCGLIPFCRR